MSLPRIAEHTFRVYDTAVNSGVTFLFALFIGYYNAATLPAYSARDVVHGFSVTRLFRNLAVGVAVMFLLACVQQVLVSHLEFGPAVLMIEVRGILVNLTFYMFLHLAYQGYQNQQVGIALERARMENLGAQYELLRQQVNPHFLFNSLNTLKYMVESADVHTVDFVLKLSDFYRFTLESRKLDLIRLAEELEILGSYMFLLKARFEEGIVLSVDVDPQHRDSRIPPFTLQLLVENAIKHNVVSLDRPLRIGVRSEGNFLVVENTLQPKRTPEAGMGMGLENIGQRYEHLLGHKIDIQVGDTTFKIKLPIVHADSHR
jgi:hypothetical protein